MGMPIPSTTFFQNLTTPSTEVVVRKSVSGVSRACPRIHRARTRVTCLVQARGMTVQKREVFPCGQLHHPIRRGLTLSLAELIVPDIVCRSDTSFSRRVPKGRGARKVAAAGAFAVAAGQPSISALMFVGR